HLRYANFPRAPAQPIVGAQRATVRDAHRAGPDWWCHRSNAPSRGCGYPRVASMFDFVRNRLYFYLLSAVFLVPGIISLALPGGLNPGIDFTSGTIMTIQFDNPIGANQLRDAFSQLGHSEAIIQQSADNTFVVRTRPLAQ